MRVASPLSRNRSVYSTRALFALSIWWRFLVLDVFVLRTLSIMYSLFQFFFSLLFVPSFRDWKCIGSSGCTIAVSDEDEKGKYYAFPDLWTLLEMILLDGYYLEQKNNIFSYSFPFSFYSPSSYIPPLYFLIL